MKDNKLIAEFKIFQNNLGYHIKQATPAEIKKLKSELEVMVMGLQERLRFTGPTKSPDK